MNEMLEAPLVVATPYLPQLSFLLSVVLLFVWSFVYLNLCPAHSASVSTLYQLFITSNQITLQQNYRPSRLQTITITSLASSRHHQNGTGAAARTTTPKYLIINQRRLKGMCVIRLNLWQKNSKNALKVLMR